MVLEKYNENMNGKNEQLSRKNNAKKISKEKTMETFKQTSSTESKLIDT